MSFSALYSVRYIQNCNIPLGYTASVLKGCSVVEFCGVVFALQPNFDPDDQNSIFNRDDARTSSSDIVV